MKSRFEIQLRALIPLLLVLFSFLLCCASFSALTIVRSSSFSLRSSSRRCPSKRWRPSWRDNTSCSKCMRCQCNTASSKGQEEQAREHEKRKWRAQPGSLTLSLADLSLSFCSHFHRLFLSALSHCFRLSAPKGYRTYPAPPPELNELKSELSIDEDHIKEQKEQVDKGQTEAIAVSSRAANINSQPACSSGLCSRSERTKLASGTIAASSAVQPFSFLFPLFLVCICVL